MNSTPPIFCPARRYAECCDGAHALHAAGGHDGAFAGADLLRGERHGAQAGAAHLVDAERGLGIGQSGGAGGLAGGILSLAGGQYLTEDHFIHVAGLDPGPLEGRSQRDRAKFVCGQRAQRAAETAHRSAGGGDDDDVVHVWLS